MHLNAHMLQHIHVKGWRVKYTQDRIGFCWFFLFNHQCPSWRGDVSPTYPALLPLADAAPSPGKEMQESFTKTKLTLLIGLLTNHQSSTFKERKSLAEMTDGGLARGALTHSKQCVLAIGGLLTALHLPPRADKQWLTQKQ